MISPMEMLFENRKAFRAWLQANCMASGGVWLILGKPGGPRTLTANEALEEALCHGWIDSQIKSRDDKTYLKYFCRRAKDSEWSEKNIMLAEKLEASGKMTGFGRAAIGEAIRGGRYRSRQRPAVTEEHIAVFIAKIKGTEPAYTNLMAMPPSVRRTYTAYPLDTKSEESAKARQEKITDRLNRNLKPV
jgi:uncharacterized protein YdeI (YjbR/CyaY-like superfamily)